MINRVAVILGYKEPLVRWINESDPNVDDPGITYDEANNDRTVYLVSDHDGENIDGWISQNFKVLFENELEEWYVDDALWPKKRDRKTFDEWFDIQCHTVIIDTLDDPIQDDEK